MQSSAAEGTVPRYQHCLCEAEAILRYQTSSNVKGRKKVRRVNEWRMKKLLIYGSFTLLSCLKYEWGALDELLLPPKMVFTFFVMSRDLFVKLGKLKF